MMRHFTLLVKDFYINPDSDITNNPFGTVTKVNVSETVFPRDKSTYTITTRSRSNYEESAGTGQNGYDRQYGKQTRSFTLRGLEVMMLQTLLDFRLLPLSFLSQRKTLLSPPLWCHQQIYCYKMLV